MAIQFSLLNLGFFADRMVEALNVLLGLAKVNSPNEVFLQKACEEAKSACEIGEKVFEWMNKPDRSYSTIILSGEDASKEGTVLASCFFSSFDAASFLEDALLEQLNGHRDDEEAQKKEAENMASICKKIASYSNSAKYKKLGNEGRKLMNFFNKISDRVLEKGMAESKLLF